MGLQRVVKLVYGVGLNDADYKIRTRIEVDGKVKSVLCPYYYRWTNMLKRCYGDGGKALYSSYEGCVVDVEWHTFSNFKAWMEQQDWEGKALDKDLLVHGNKVYSKDTCCFVDPYLNALLTKVNNKTTSDGLPLGVMKAVRGNSTCYMASMVRHDSKRDEKWGKGCGYLGYEKDPIKAHRLWQSAKAQLLKDILPTYADPVVKKGIARVIDMLEEDIKQNRETKYL